MDLKKTKEAILKERAERLAKPLHTEIQKGTILVLEFLLAKEKYALESIYIREVSPLREKPHGCKWTPTHTFLWPIKIPKQESFLFEFQCAAALQASLLFLLKSLLLFFLNPLFIRQKKLIRWVLEWRG